LKNAHKKAPVLESKNMPLSIEQKEIIATKVKYLCEKVGIKTLPVEYFNAGRRAGAFSPRDILVKFHEDIAEANFDTFINTTLPHEVAHYLDFIRCGNRVRRSNSGKRDMHGQAWKRACADLGYAGLKRCHSFEAGTPSRRVYKTFIWNCPNSTCSKKEYKVKTVMDRNMVKEYKAGQGRVCRKCKSVLVREGKRIARQIHIAIEQE
jgi:predicted SprT family Zn-dependent metalloprotease